jgi:hypothetical protein
VRPFLDLGARVLCAAALALAACASKTPSQSCMERADEAYRRCMHPMGGFNEIQAQPGQPPQYLGAEAQGCEQSHQQAVAQCGGGPEAPVPNIFDDAGTSADAS